MRKTFLLTVAAGVTSGLIIIALQSRIRGGQNSNNGKFYA